jgi:septal ring factor EnvC (AmiA/AmiB activator)
VVALLGLLVLLALSASAGYFVRGISITSADAIAALEKERDDAVANVAKVTAEKGEVEQKLAVAVEDTKRENSRAEDLANSLSNAVRKQQAVSKELKVLKEQLEGLENPAALLAAYQDLTRANQLQNLVVSEILTKVNAYNATNPPNPIVITPELLQRNAEYGKIVKDLNTRFPTK